MQTIAPYPYPAVLPPQESSLKKTLIYTVAGGLAVTGIVVYARYAYKKSKAEKADAKSFQTGSPETNAKLIRMAFDTSKPGKMMKDIRNVMLGMQSQEEFGAVQEKYKSLYDKPLWDTISQKLQTNQYHELLAIKHGKPLRPGMKAPYLAQWQGWARRLRAAFDRTYWLFNGTDDGAVQAVINEIPTQKEFINTGVIYKQEFKENLMTRFKREAEGNELSIYLRQIVNKPKQ